MMLDEQISKVLDEIVHIEETISRIREIADKKDKEILELSKKISDAMHRLEMADDLSDEEAARLGKEIATTRKERRECKNFTGRVQPLMMFYAAHGPAMDALKNACTGIVEMKEAVNNGMFVSRSTGEATNVVTGEVATTGWKPPRPVLCTTKGGITIHFGSVGAAARAFGYNKRQIFDCCYGAQDDIDGDKFVFVTGDNTTHVAPFSAVRGKLEAELAARNAPQEPEPKSEPKITDVYPEPKKRRGGIPPIAVRVTSPDGVCTEYESVNAAEKATGINDSVLHYALKHSGICKGYKIERI